MAYTSLSPELSLDYEAVKVAVLRAYELVPEAYCQKFRRFKKIENQTYVEFGREKEVLFDRWCSSKGVKDFDKLRDLVLLGYFRNCLHDKICIYINEQKVSKLSDAVVLADEYVLTHRETFDKFHSSSERSVPVFKPCLQGRGLMLR